MLEQPSDPVGVQSTDTGGEDHEVQTLEPFPPVLTVAQLADLLQLPKSSTYELISRHEIPGVRKIGRHLRVCRDSVLDWLSGDDSRVSRSAKRGTR